MKKTLLALVATLTFAGYVEAQNMERLGPWMWSVSVDQMTDVVFGVALMRQDNPPRVDPGYLAISCSNDGAWEFGWMTGQIMDGTGRLAYRFDDEPVQDQVWLAGSDSYMSDRPLHMLARLQTADRLLFRGASFVRGLITMSFSPRDVNLVIDRLAEACGSLPE
jgi:hypothetical protein